MGPLWVMLAACGASTTEEVRRVQPVEHGAVVAPAVPWAGSPCEVQDIAFEVEGRLFTADGAPVASTMGSVRGPERVVTFESSTNESGAYRFASSDGLRLRVMGTESFPREYCIGVPKRFKFNHPEGAEIRMLFEDMNFIVPPHCPVTFTSIEPRQDLTLVVDGMSERWAWDVSELPATISLPCAGARVAWIADTWVSAPPLSDDCVAPPGFQCTPVGGGTVAMEWIEAQTLEVQVTGEQDAPLEGAAILGALAPTVTDAAGMARVVLPSNQPFALHVAAVGHTSSPERWWRPSERMDKTPWRVALQSARLATVRCLGLPHDRCQDLPWIEHEAGSYPCAWERGGHPVCPLPPVPVVARLPGLSLDVGDKVETIWFDLRAP